jgi:hypothetical protein
MLCIVANRILCVGDTGRGARIATHFDDGRFWKHVAPRNFVVYTGLYKTASWLIVRMCAVSGCDGVMALSGASVCCSDTDGGQAD